MKTKLFYLIKICFFIVIIFISVYLKENDFLSFIAPIGAFDQTHTIIEFREFSNILIGSSLLVFIMFFIYYKLAMRLSYVTCLDKVILSYYLIFFIIIFAAKFSRYEFSSEIAQLALRLSAITYLQVYLFQIVPVGIIIYIPIIYLFFIQKRIQ